MTHASAVLSPSDLSRVAEGARNRFGGRVVDSKGAVLTIADAWVVVDVELCDGQPSVAPGSLILVEASRCAERLVDAEVLGRFASRRGAGVAREHDRLWRRGIAHNLLKRAQAICLAREWFEHEGFIEVDTPQRVPSPGLDLHLDAFACDSSYLITSPELQMKRLLAGGVPRVFQFVHCFRKGEVGRWHNPEFLMLEWYRTFAGMEEVIGDTERLVADVVRGLLGRPQIQAQAMAIDLTPPYERLSVCDAFARFAGTNADEVLRLARHDETMFFRLLTERVEPGLTQWGRPVFLTDYPAEQASLARLRPDDPRFCERFELYVAGQEICNGFGELVDPALNRTRFERDAQRRRRASKPLYPTDVSFLEALEDGMPPSGGNALGFDRLLTLCLGASGIADVMPFPEGWL